MAPRCSGEMSSSAPADRGSAGTVARAHARHEPLSGDEIVAGLFALVLLRFRYDLSGAVGKDSSAKIGTDRNIEQSLCDHRAVGGLIRINSTVSISSGAFGPRPNDS